MKQTTNITNTFYDLERFSGGCDMISFCRSHGLDGLELLPCVENTLGNIPKPLILGIHLRYFPCWIDFWNGNWPAVIAEFGAADQVVRQFGGETPDALITFYQKQLDFAESAGAKYVVFHVSDVSLAECVTYRFLHTDEQVIQATLQLLDRLLAGKHYSFEFLVENLWWPGFTMTRPQITEMLMDGIPYARKGIMLDTGHLLHTNLHLRTPDEGLGYIHEMLSLHPGIEQWIRGIHLQQSISGASVRDMLRHPPRLSGDYRERLGEVYSFILEIDRHLPFETAAVRGLIDRIKPEYLTHEFITNDRSEHDRFLRIQSAALRG